MEEDCVTANSDCLDSSDEEGCDWMLKVTDNSEENRCLLSESEEEGNEAIINQAAGTRSLEMRQPWITFDEEVPETKVSLDLLSRSLGFTPASPTPGIHGSDLQASLSGTEVTVSRASSLRSGICQVSDSDSLNYLYKDDDSTGTGLMTTESFNDWSLMTQSNDCRRTSESRLQANHEVASKATVALTQEERTIVKKKNKKLSKVMKLFGRLGVKMSRKNVLVKVRSADSARKRGTYDRKTAEDDLSSECLLGSHEKTLEDEAIARVKKSPSENLIRRLFSRFKKTTKPDFSKKAWLL